MKARRESKVNVIHWHIIFWVCFFFNVRGKDGFSFHPHPFSDFTFARMCEAIKYAENYGRALCAREKREKITKEASVTLRGIGRAGCWKRVEMTNGILCN